MKDWQFWGLMGALMAINSNVTDNAITRVSSSIIAFALWMYAFHKSRTNSDDR